MLPDLAPPPHVTAAAERLDDLVHAFEQHPDPVVQERVFDLLQCIDVLHRAGLQRLGELLKVAGLQRRALDDPEVKLLFDLYDLGEGGEQMRADAVLQTVRPYIESHGGHLEVVEAELGVVRIRLSGACHGCQGSAATLRNVVEQALRLGMPDLIRMEVLDPEPSLPRNFVPISSLTGEKRPSLTWETVLRVDEVPKSSVRAVALASPGSTDQAAVLVANLGGEFYAYRNACPGSPLPLDTGIVQDGMLVCPWHGCRFDLRGGRRVETEGPGLGVVPIAIIGNEVRIGILAGASR